MARGKKGGEKPKMATPNIVIEDELWAELRMQAIRERTSASEIVRRLVSDYLNKQKKGGKRE
jgi:predicted CopG family antitoxin